MTPKRERFIEEYLIDLNETQAAIRAGYSSKSAYSIGQHLLKNVEVKSRVDKAIADRSRRTGINQDRVLRELARLAFVNLAAVVDTDTATIKPDASPDDTAAISYVRIRIIPGAGGNGVEREIRFYEKTKALELLGRHLGMFTDKLQIGAALPVQIIDNIPDVQIPESTLAKTEE